MEGQELLKKIRLDDGRSLWTKFGELVAKLLGLEPDTAFLRLIDLTERIATEPAPGRHGMPEPDRPFRGGRKYNLYQRAAQKVPVPDRLISSYEKLSDAMMALDPDKAIRVGSWDVGNFTQMGRSLNIYNKRRGGIPRGGVGRRRIELRTLLEDMDVPAMRLDLTSPSNLRWLDRNLAANNSNHPMFTSARDLLTGLLRPDRGITVESLQKAFDESADASETGWSLVRLIDDPVVTGLWKDAKREVDSFVASIRQEEAPPGVAMYSKLDRALEGMQPRVSADELEGFLRKRQVKAEEVRDTGLQDLIEEARAEGRGLTKEEIQHHVAANTLPLDVKVIEGEDTSYPTYIAGLGENYREFIFAFGGDKTTARFISHNWTWTEGTAQAGHVRTTDLTLEDGTKVLEIQEIQSDLQQRAQKYGAITVPHEPGPEWDSYVLLNTDRKLLPSG